MKKAFKLFAVFFVVSFILLTAGGLAIKKDSVNYGEIYNHFAKLVNTGQSENIAQVPQLVDISSAKGLTSEDSLTYQLNEFNTIEIYANSCIAELHEAEGSDKLSISYDYKNELKGNTAIHTAVKDGTLYIQNEFSDTAAANKEDVSIILQIPDSFKGGYSLKGENCIYKLESPESAMDIDISVINSSVEACDVTAENISVMLNDSKADIETLTAEEGVVMNCASSQMTVDGINAVYTNANISSAVLTVLGANGSFNLNADFSRIAARFSQISANLQLNFSKSQAEVTFPKNTDALLRYKGGYSVFKNNTTLEYSDEENKNNRYFVETNVDFSIVTFAEK